MPAPARSSLRLALLPLLTVLTVLSACALPRTARAKAAADADRRVRYRLELPAPHRQYVHVRMEVPSPTGRSARVAMPAWTPGSYLVRDFGRHVYDLSATDDRGASLTTERLDKQTWRIDHGGRAFSVRYRVFAAEPSVRTSHVDERHASLVGTSVFLYVVDQLARPAQVEVALPPGWSAHAALDPVPAPAGLARFEADDYDALVDAPIELGTPQVLTFREGDATFEYVLTGAEGTGIDGDRLVADAAAVVRAQGALMGGFPLSRYVFLMRISDRGGGGLEHANSTSMMMRRSAFDRDAGYDRASRLTAHEFFHLWNVKRIHDRALGPFDYSRENHSRLLWLHEGFTETMEGYSLLRAGLLEPEAYLRDLAKRWTQYLQKPGRNHDSIASLSFDAWIKAYQPAPNHPNVAISYYEKGELIGIALDLELRLRSAAHGRAGSLPGLFRRLMASHGARGQGITTDDVVAAASAEAGEPMEGFFADYVEGTRELPLPALLARVGVAVRRSAPWHAVPEAELTRAQRQQRLWTGLDLTDDARIRNLVPGSPADDAGLMRDDELLAIEGLRVRDRAAILARFADYRPGDAVRVVVVRDDRLEERTLRLHESPARKFSFTLVADDELSAEVLRLRTQWLGGAHAG